MKKVILNFILLPLITFVVGWKIGTIQGASAQIQLSEAVKSDAVLFDLRLLRKKDYHSLQNMKENDLDFALLSHKQYEQSYANIILYPYSDFYSEVLNSGLKSAINYKKKFSDKEYRKNLLKYNTDIKDFYEQIDAYLKEKQRKI